MWFFIFFCNFLWFFLRIGLYWRALVKSRIPNIGKRREISLFIFLVKKSDFVRFSDFLKFFVLLVFIYRFFSKLLRLLLNVMEVTIEHQKCPKIGTNSMKSLFCQKGKTSLGQRQSAGDRRHSKGARSNPA